MDFEGVVLSHIRRNALLDGVDHVVVGFSGGVDSVALLDFLFRNAIMLGIDLTAVHVHHGIRGELADRDAHFAESFCRFHGIDFRLFKRDIPRESIEQGIGIEEAGRKARYDIFESVRSEKPNGAIAVAHHADDQAETLLMRLFRGSGLDGMTAMKPIRGSIIRPFLCVTKEDLRSYCSQRGLESIEDETNAVSDYLRNRLRNELIPWLKTNVNNNIVERLNDAASLLEADRAYLQQVADVTRKRIFFECDTHAEVELDCLSDVPDVILTRIIRDFIRQRGSLRDIGMAELNGIVRIIRSGTHNKGRTSGGVRFMVAYDRLRMSWVNNESSDGHRLEIHLMDRNAFEQQKLGIDEIAIDAMKVKGKLDIRYRQEGDVFQPFGSSHRKKLKKFFIDGKIPVEQRARVPLVVDRIESEDTIVWVCPYRLSERYRIDHTSSKIAILRVCEVVQRDANMIE